MSTVQTLWEDLNLGQKSKPMFLNLKGDLPSNTGAVGTHKLSQVIGFVNTEAKEGLVWKDKLILK